MSTTLLVGNGIVKQGWMPIKIALQNTFGRVPESDPNLAFAIITYQLRWLWYQRYKNPDNKIREDAICLFNEKYRLYESLKENIVLEIKKATERKLISIIDEFSHVFKRFVVTDDCGLITTNWDLLLEQYNGYTFKEVNYLHGNINDSQGLYLPTENIIEPYRPGAMESKEHAKATGKFTKTLEKTDRLIIYGLSLSPLDAWLGIVLADGFYGTDKPYEVIIVDINPELVADRFQYLIHGKKPYCYHPNEI